MASSLASHFSSFRTLVIKNLYLLTFLIKEKSFYPLLKQRKSELKKSENILRVVYAIL